MPETTVQKFEEALVKFPEARYLQLQHELEIEKQQHEVTQKNLDALDK